jgi:PTS system mannose-specific IIA component
MSNEPVAMIGILIFTHGSLCRALREGAERLTGERPFTSCLSIRKAEPLDNLVRRVDSTLNHLDSGKGVLVFVDVTGGTPWNVIGRIRSDGSRHLRLLSGTGIPVFIKALQDRGEHGDLDAWVEELAHYAASGVKAG